MLFITLLMLHLYRYAFQHLTNLIVCIYYLKRVTLSTYLSLAVVAKCSRLGSYTIKIKYVTLFNK